MLVLDEEFKDMFPPPVNATQTKASNIDGTTNVDTPVLPGVSTAHAKPTSNDDADANVSVLNPHHISWDPTIHQQANPTPAKKGRPSLGKIFNMHLKRAISANGTIQKCHVQSTLRVQDVLQSDGKIRRGKVTQLFKNNNASWYMNTSTVGVGYSPTYIIILNHVLPQSPTN
jgi:hypothetical protein